MTPPAAPPCPRPGGRNERPAANPPVPRRAHLGRRRPHQEAYMDPISAHDGLTSAYRILTELGGCVGGVWALTAGLLAYAAGARQARATRRAADEQIAAMRVQMEGLKRATDDADERRREDLRFALAREAARIGEFVAHRYRVIPMECGP